MVKQKQVGANNMKIFELFEQTNQPGKWVYHASFVPNKNSVGSIANWLKKVISRGLQPSTEGYMGAGTYFAYEPTDVYYHVTPDDSLLLRVKFSDLVKLYGVYPKNKNGIQRDNEQIIVPGPVPSKLLQVEYFEDEWWDLSDALGAETREYYGEAKTSWC